MGCQRYQKSWSAYLQGDVDGAQREAMERHLRGCAACRRDLETLRRTVELVRMLPALEPQPQVQAQLFRKIRVVRQPMSWLEALRFRWRVDGLRTQARAWGVGVAATVLLCVFGANSLEQWSTNRTENLSVGIGMATRPAPSPEGGSVPVQPHMARPEVRHATARVVAFPQTPMVAGAPGLVYLAIEASRDLPDAELRLYPPAGVAVGEGAILQEDASYLIYRGAVAAGHAQNQWVAVRVRPAQEGLCTLRVVLTESGRVLADELVSLNVMASPQ